VGIELERPPNIPCLLLREAEGDRRVLPIFIGSPEATAIAFALEEVETPRPMTHDLIKDVFDELGATLERVVVTELRDATFFAEIVVSIAGTVHSVSARPSDAVALAVRFGCAVAGISVTRPGAAPSMPRLAEVEALRDVRGTCQAASRQARQDHGRVVGQAADAQHGCPSGCPGLNSTILVLLTGVR